MNVLVTGGAGYVGSVLVRELLVAGHGVRVFDRLIHGGESLLGVWSHPKFQFLSGDIRNQNLVSEALAGVDAVVHLAAIVGDPACARHPEETRMINLEASLQLFDQCRQGGVSRFIFSSTCSNYGRMKDPTQYVDERSELQPVSLYAETKVGVEKYLLGHSPRNDTHATVLRFATVFGVSPRMRFDLTVNEFTMEMISKKHLVVFGEKFWRPYIHVSDVARALLLVLTAPVETVSSKVFNVGSTTANYQKQQLVEMIRPHAKDARVEFLHKDEDPRDYRVSFEKIKRELKFSPIRSVPDGIYEIAQLVLSGVIRDYSLPQYRN